MHLSTLPVKGYFSKDSFTCIYFTEVDVSCTPASIFRSKKQSRGSTLSPKTSQFPDVSLPNGEKDISSVLSGCFIMQFVEPYM
jgi:hypothetical protein